jgi:hypothetical protein
MEIDELEAQMAWLRIESGMPRDSKVAELSSDDARWAYIVMLCAAKEQEGHFASWAHLEACVPQKHWKFLNEMVEVGLLMRVADGADEAKARFEVANWDKYQRPYDPNNAARVARSRAKKKADDNGEVTDGNGALQTITPNALRYDTVRYATDGIDNKAESAPRTDRQRILKWLTDEGMQKPVGYVLNDLLDMVKGYGFTATVSALEYARNSGNKTTKAMVAAAETSFRVGKRTVSPRSATPTNSSVYDSNEEVL